MAAKRVIVKGDAVKGSDTHTVQGSGTNPNGTTVPSASWKGTYPYDGAVTEALSDFVTIGHAPVALVQSRSTLSGGHGPDSGAPFTPLTPTPNPGLSFAKTVGKGTPGTGAGSSFVTVGNKAVLLDGDKIDTCGDEQGSGNSAVASSTQSFVTVTEAP